MDLVGRASATFGTATALATSGRTYSFTDVEDETARIVAILHEAGVSQGDIVALVAPNSPEMVLTLFALLRLGAVAAPVNHRFPAGQTGKVLQCLRPRLLLLDKGVRGISTEAPAVILQQFVSSAGNAQRIPESILSLDMERPATVMHTSASSGMPKAAVHSTGNHWHNAAGANMNMPFAPGDCWLLSLPLCHVGGYALLFRSLAGGGAIAVGSQESSLEELLDRFKVTHLSLVTTQLYRLLGKPAAPAAMARLKALLLGGSAVPAPLLDVAVRERLPVYLSYGSTEMGSQITTTPYPLSRPVSDSGKILPFRELSIAGDGEILVKGPCLFQGYLENGVLQPRTDGSGWFHTNDIGTLDGNGSLTVIGRKDNMFVSGGENIHPEEIEKAIIDLPGIEQALVAPCPDREYGLRPVAFIQTSGNDDLSDETIGKALGSSLGKLKCPIALYRVDEWLTLAGSGKIDRTRYKLIAMEKAQDT
jgi:O-succinylbenzoic acid--CoA ligase